MVSRLLEPSRTTVVETAASRPALFSTSRYSRHHLERRKHGRLQPAARGSDIRSAGGPERSLASPRRNTPILASRESRCSFLARNPARTATPRGFPKDTWGYYTFPDDLVRLDAMVRAQEEYRLGGGVAQLLVVDPYGGVWAAALDGTCGGRSIMESASRIEYWRNANVAALPDGGFPQLERVPPHEVLELGLTTDLNESFPQISSRILAAGEVSASRNTSEGPSAAPAHQVYDEDTYPTLLARCLGEDFVATAQRLQLAPPVTETPPPAPRGIPRPPSARNRLPPSHRLPDEHSGRGPGPTH